MECCGKVLTFDGKDVILLTDTCLEGWFIGKEIDQWISILWLIVVCLQAVFQHLMVVFAIEYVQLRNKIIFYYYLHI